MFSKRPFRLATAGLAFCLTAGIAACDDGANDADLEEPAAGEVMTDDVDIDEVRLGRAIGADMRIADEVNEFMMGDSIYVSVRLDGSANPAQVTARWTTESDSLVHEETKTVAAGEQWAWFALGTAQLPEGDYELKLLADGDEDEEREFSIKRGDS